MKLTKNQKSELEWLLNRNWTNLKTFQTKKASTGWNKTMKSLEGKGLAKFIELEEGKLPSPFWWVGKWVEDMEDPVIYTPMGGLSTFLRVMSGGAWTLTEKGLEEISK